MALKVRFSTILLLSFLLLALNVHAQNGVFDVTTAPYGGKPDSDITQALSKAWADACASPTASKVVIPAGTYQLGAVEMVGPCTSLIELQVDGTLQAPDSLTQVDGWLKFEHIDPFHLFGTGVFDGRGQAAWAQNDCSKDSKCDTQAMNLRFDFVSNATVEGVTSKDSKNFHVNVIGCQNLTFTNFKVSAPKESLNTDGIHIGRSNGVNIIDTTIQTGDDCISLGDGSQEIRITGVECGPGHGISVGSLGKYKGEEPVSGIYVKNCTFTNTDNGLRIKSWPALETGTATEIHFEDIIMNNVSNPILIDQDYCPYGQCNDQAPSKVKISNVSFKNIKGTSSTADAVKLLCSSGLPCENVELVDINLAYSGAEGPIKAECDNVKPTITGTLTAPGC